MKMLHVSRILHHRCLEFQNVFHRANRRSYTNFPTTILTKKGRNTSPMKLKYLIVLKSDFHVTQQVHSSLFFTLVTYTCLKWVPIILGLVVRRKLSKASDEERNRYREWINKRKKMIAGVFGLYGCALIYYYLSARENDPVLKRPRFMIFDKHERKEVGKSMTYALLVQYQDRFLPMDHPLYKRLQRVLNKLVAANHEVFMKIPNWGITIIDAPINNAMAMPNANIFIYSGLFNACQNDDQLAFILAHEMSHVLLLHSYELFSYLLLKQALHFLPAFLIWTAFPKFRAFFCYMLSHAFLNISFLFPYKRSMESEADDMGLQMSVKACYDAREIIVYWKMMEKLSILTGERLYQIPWLIDHPDHGRRAMNITERLPNALKIRELQDCPALPSRDPRVVFDKMSMKDLEIYFKKNGLI